MFRKRTVGQLTHTLVTLVCILSLLLTSLPLAPPPAYAQGGTEPTPSGKGQLTIPVGPPGVSVNPYNGNVHYHRVDLVTSPGGYPFPVLQSELFYNTLDSAYRGFGRGWRFGYDVSYYDSGQYIEIFWPDGRRDSFEKQGEGEFIPPPGVYDRLEALGNEGYRLTTLDGTVYYFDSSRHRKVTRMETQNGLLLTFSYDENGYLTTVQDVYGRALHLGDEFSRVVSIFNDFLNRSLTLSYDADGNLIQITDSAGLTTSYSYYGVSGSAQEHPLARITYPDGQVAVFGYYQWCDEFYKALRGYCEVDEISYGQVMNAGDLHLNYGEGVTRVNGDYYFDDRGRTTKIEYDYGGVVTYTWDDRDNLIAATDAAGNTTYYTYDEAGNVLSITDPLGNTWDYTYIPGTSLLLSQQDPLGHAWHCEYDDLGRLVKIIDPSEAEYAFAYDAFSNLTIMTDTLGNTFYATYDAWGRRITEENPVGQQTQFVYDDRDFLQYIGYPNGITQPIIRNYANSSSTASKGRPSTKLATCAISPALLSCRPLVVSYPANSMLEEQNGQQLQSQGSG